MSNHIIWLQELGINDIERVGGKNASLGEMIRHLSQADIRVPGGFATTVDAFHDFIEKTGLAERISTALANLDVNDVVALAETGRMLRQAIIETDFPEDLLHEISEAYDRMVHEYGGDFSVAVRSSATAEDLPDASFAGQQETFLNVRGKENVIAKVKEVFASLYNDRAIAYRVHHKFEHDKVGISAGIQKMVRSDCGASGVMFTLDTESGFRDAVFITSAYGLGETVVQGAVNPDEFYVYKPALTENKQAILRRNLGSKAIRMTYASRSGADVLTEDVPEDLRDLFSITDDEVLDLAKQAVLIEEHYQKPMDIEWARDGVDGKIYIVQARPETVKSRSAQTIERYQLKEKSQRLCEGRSIGQKIGKGMARVVSSVKEMHKVEEGDVLVTDMTDPDWEPIMKRASAIVTNRGGRTCHAAIIARELGIPAVVGCGNATTMIQDNVNVTVSCSEGDTGVVYEGLLDFDIHRADLEKMPEAPLKIMMNVGNPERAFDFANLPNHGVGLARLEFIINRMIGIHPKALIHFDEQEPELQEQIGKMIRAYGEPVNYFVQRLVEGVSTIAAAFAPQPVIFRMSDFKSNEYANLVGGRRYEPHEENPMLGFRGASRYISESFRECFELECRAMKQVREEMGLDNVWLMIPFVRTLSEAEAVIALLEEQGLKRGDKGLKIVMMCELPSNALLAEQFLELFDGFSIGSNDLTQLTLGLDRDSGLIADLFDERNDAVKAMLSMAIKACREKGKYIGICGQGPSDHPDLAKWLMEQGIESMSLNPDSVVETWLSLASA